MTLVCAVDMSRRQIAPVDLVCLCAAQVRRFQGHAVLCCVTCSLHQNVRQCEISATAPSSMHPNTSHFPAESCSARRLALREDFIPAVNFLALSMSASCSQFLI